MTDRGPHSYFPAGGATTSPSRLPRWLYPFIWVYWRDIWHVQFLRSRVQSLPMPKEIGERTDHGDLLRSFAAGWWAEPTLPSAFNRDWWRRVHAKFAKSMTNG